MARLGAWLWQQLLALFAATLDQIHEFPACFLLGGLLMRRDRHEPIELFDVGALAVLWLLVGILVRRVAQAPQRSVAGWGRYAKLPQGTDAPTASWAHLLWGGAYIWFGTAMWTMRDVSGPAPREYHGFGLGVVLVAGGLLLVRAGFWIARALRGWSDSLDD